jgi:DNA-binding NarL/FixJ family response regulator
MSAERRRPITVALVDDEPMFRTALGQALSDAGLELVGEGGDAAEAIELEIFTLLASGNSNQDIGRELALSSNTVSNHIASILDKLHLDNRIQAAVEGVRSGMS